MMKILTIYPDSVVVVLLVVFVVLFVVTGALVQTPHLLVAAFQVYAYPVMALE
jgi:hypothetical protein